MDTVVSSNGARVSVHGVARVAVSADRLLRGDGELVDWQELALYDAQGERLGTLVLFLDSPDAALPVGNQPPYWGVDIRKPLAMDGDEAPF